MAERLDARAAIRVSANGAIQGLSLPPPEPDPDTCQCDACEGGVLHSSGCAVHRAPAEPNGPCNCGAQAKAERRYVALALHLASNQIARCKAAVIAWGAKPWKN